MPEHRLKNVATYIYFPLRDADGLNVTGSANPDSEKDTYADGTAPNGWVDCTNEATEIGTDGWYYLLLTQAEMNFDRISIQIKSDDALTQNILIDTTLLTKINAIFGKIPTNYIMGSSVVTDKDDEIDAILGDTDTMEADIKTYLDAIEANLDGDIVAVKADTAAILLDTDTLEADLKTYLDAIETNIIVEIDANETKIDLIQTDTTAILGDTDTMEADLKTYLDAIEANLDGDIVAVKADTAAILIDTDTLETDLKTYLDAIETNIIVEVDANETKIDTMQGNVTDILLDTGTTIPGTITSLQSNVTDILADTDTLEADLKTYLDAIETNIIVEIDANETKIDLIQTDTTNIDAKTTNLPGDPASETNVNANETKIDTMQGNVTDILLDTGTTIPNQITGLNNLSSADVQTVLETNRLDEIVQTTAGGTDPTIGSMFDLLFNKDGSQTYDQSTDSLEAQVDAGGSGDWSPDEKTEIKTVLGITNTGTPDSTPSDGVLKEVQDNVDTNEGKINTLQTDSTAIKAKTDNLPSNTENEIIKIQGVVGATYSVTEFTFDVNNDNTGYIIYIYDTKAHAEAHVEGDGLQTGGLFELPWVNTFTSNYPDMSIRVIEP